MRYLAMFLGWFLLSGCAVSLTPRPYDAVEYKMSTVMTVDATRAIHVCSESKVKDSDFWKHIHELNTDSLDLDEFIRNKADSNEFIVPMTQVRDMINTLVIKGQFSEYYCIDKLTNIQASTRIISRVMGKTDTHAMCDGGIKDRYNRFLTDYHQGRLNKSEFQDLSNDVIKLGKVDTSSCSEARKNQLLEDLQFIQSSISVIMSL